jgi:predicted nucleotidyltransferase
MRTDLDHLPPAKQRELERVVQILFEEFEEATARATQDWKKKGRILKVILYGSYARGGWVDEPHTAKGYQSDFDLLIVVNHVKLTDRIEFWSRPRTGSTGSWRSRRRYEPRQLHRPHAGAGERWPEAGPLLLHGPRP